MTPAPLSPTSTNKLRDALFNEMADGVMMVDRQGVIIDCNPAFHQNLGYEKDEVIGMTVATINSPEFADSVAERQEQVVLHGQATFETAHIRKDGTVMPVELNARTFENEGTTIFFGIVRDISIRKQNEAELRRAHDELEARVLERTQQLRASEERFRDIAESSSDWFWEMDEDLKFSYLTDSYLRITGIDPASIMGKTRLALARDGDDVERWKNHMVVLQKRLPFRGLQYDIKRQDGSTFPVNISGKPFFDEAGHFKGYRGSGSDISQHVMRERKLIETASELKGVLESTSQGYWRIDGDAKTIEVNPRMAEILGVSQDQAVGTSVYDYLSQEQQAHHKTKIKRRAVGQSEAYELILTSAAGNDVPCLFNATPFHDTAGEINGSFALVTDITEFKNTQSTLEKSILEAKAANKVKSDLMANMSHELRTPLNAIIGFSSTIQQEVFGPVGHDKYREYLIDINNSGQHLLELINDILDVSAIEAGALDLHEENISPLALIEASIRIIRPRAMAGVVNVTTDVDANLAPIYVDERRCKQVMLNLLSNAVKFTPKGGDVSVTAGQNEDGSFSIAVSDTGIGMDDGEVTMALSTFGQVDSGLDRKHEGTGLGLPLTKGLIELHGGTLAVKSEKGHGTLMTVTFPKDRVRTN